MNPFRTPWLLALCPVIVVLLAQPARPLAAAHALESAVRVVLDEADPALTVGGRPVDVEPLSMFYAERQDHPLWIVAGGIGPRGEALQNALAEAGRDGLYAVDYELPLSLRGAKNEPDLARAEVMLSAVLVRYALDLRRGRAFPAKRDRDQDVTPKPLDPVAILGAAAAAPDLYAYLQTLVPEDPVYRGLREALAEYRSIAAHGGWGLVPDRPTLSVGSVGRAVEALRSRLRLSGDLPADSAVPTLNRFDEPLRQAVVAFQARHGLAPDGSVGPRTRTALNVPVDERIRQILVNLERARWLPEDLGDPYVLVNMAAFDLEVVEADRVALEMRVVVGRPARSTPMFSDEITYLEFNPYWHVPRTILREDKLPILRSDPAALTAQGIRVIAPGGTVVDPTTINWSEVSASNFPYSLRQDPGPRNALGRVKFMFPNAHDIYLHDSPSRGLFKRSTRAYSSGCIRVEKPIELAEFLLKNNDGWNRRRIEGVIAAGKNRSVVLPNPVAVHLVYLTAWMGRDGRVQFRNDLYNRDARLVAALDAPREIGLVEPGLLTTAPLKR
jgi:L,D-transpeptidase YcbB